MSLHFKEKELSAVKGKIKTTRKHSGFFVKNFWKVIGCGILFSIWAPTYTGGHYITGRRSVTKTSELDYYELVILTAILYTTVSFLAHFVWKYQDKIKLKRLEKRKVTLEKELGIK